MTIETLQLTFGAVMDGAAVLAVCVYMPVANFIIRLKEIADDPKPMYWWESEEDSFEPSISDAMMPRLYTGDKVEIGGHEYLVVMGINPFYKGIFLELKPYKVILRALSWYHGDKHPERYCSLNTELPFFTIVN